MAQNLVLESVLLEATLGFLKEEDEPQELYASLEMSLDGYTIAKTDEIEDGLDYTKVIEEMRSFSDKFDGFSLEKFTADLADHLEKTFAVKKLRLMVNKPRYAEALQVQGIAIEEVRG